MICKVGDIICQVATNSALIREAQKLRHDVYLAEGYIKEPCAEGIIPDCKNGASTYLVALDGAEELVGVMRLSPPVPTFDVIDAWRGNFLPRVGCHLLDVCSKNSVELGSLAVKKSARTRKISWALYKATLLYSLMQEIDYWLIAVDDRVFRSLEILGWHINKVGNSIDYMGSPSTLGVMPVRNQLKSVFEKNPTHYSYLAS
ncbi:MAG TPA: hypothetical protein DD454_01925 [Candidatus Moranbacteria bacterium]|nr:hypothetical protein [Candidatus Moranbacteria bacterium]